MLAVVMLVIVLSGLSGEILTYFAGSFIRRIDPQNYFFTSSFVYFCSLIYTLIIMKAFSRNGFQSWGFNLRNYKLSLKVFFLFCVVHTPLIYFTMVLDDARETVAAGKSIDTIGIAGSLANHLFINGIYQEALFRGFIMVFLARTWSGVWQVGSIKIPHTAFWATLIFVLAHFRWGQEQLFDWWQVGFSVVLGLYYSIMFYKTNSLLNPILSHSYSNAVYVALLIVQSTIFSSK